MSLKPGPDPPDVELPDPHGATTTLRAALGDRRAVLVCYRGA